MPAKKQTKQNKIKAELLPASLTDAEKKKKAKIIDSRGGDLQSDYINELDTNPRYSLEVDPTDKYGMSDEEKKFVRLYVNLRNLPLVATIMGIEIELANSYYMAFSTQDEIRRISMAMYHRQFATRLLTLDELGGYLTSMLTDMNTAEADRLKPRDKLEVVRIIMDLHKMKNEAILQNPSGIMQKDIETELKDLSVDTIKSLIAERGKDKEKDDIISNFSGVSPEEAAYLSTLSAKELLGIVENMQGDKTKSDEGKK